LGSNAQLNADVLSFCSGNSGEQFGSPINYYLVTAVQKDGVDSIDQKGIGIGIGAGLDVNEDFKVIRLTGRCGETDSPSNGREGKIHITIQLVGDKADNLHVPVIGYGNFGIGNGGRSPRHGQIHFMDSGLRGIPDPPHRSGIVSRRSFIV